MWQLSSLADTRHRAGDAEVNGGSGFWQTLLGKRTTTVGEAEEPFAPNAQSRWLLEHVKADLRGELTKAVAAITHAKRTVASPTDLDGSHPAYLLRRLAMLALDMEIDPKVTFGEAVERLQWAWGMLNERAAAQAAFERHSPVNAAEAAADGALLAAAARRGKEIGPGSQRGQVAVAEIVDRAVKAPEPTELQAALTPEVLAEMDAQHGRVAQTAVLPVIDAVTVGHGVSPVHVSGDGTTPPLPDEDESADPGAGEPLPKRIPYGESSQVVAQATEAGEQS